MKKRKANIAKIEILMDGIGCDEGDIIFAKEPIKNRTIYYYDSFKKWFELEKDEENITWRLLK